MTIAPTKQILMSDMFTDNEQVGARRFKVEDGSTAFALGKNFRAFREFSILDGETYAIKITTPINFNLTGLVLNLESGGVKYEAVNSPVDNGGWIDTFTPIPLNNRTDKPEAYTSQLTLEGGGSITGGFVADVALVRVGTNNQRTSIVEGLQSIRGLHPDTYYLTLTGTSGTANGVIYANWEEWP